MNEKILVIDDDQEHNSLLHDYLGANGFLVHAVEHPDDGFEFLEHEMPDAIILDVMLPDMDGFTVCKEIRKRHSVPILMLTAKGDVHDRIVGLEIGADDYLPKPFEPRELVARLRSILRRSNEKAAGQIERYGALSINYSSRTVTHSGEEVNLTTNEYLLLQYLIRNRGRVMERSQLIEHLRGIDWESSDRSIDMLISRIRQKLRDDSRNPSYIKTVTGMGYIFICKSQSAG
ncbi:MAG: response regulator transcription factor [Chitinispirillaceae bacterium]|nr:response regulator transcription factor [Chitinispirillaceae bacterium]